MFTGETWTATNMTRSLGRCPRAKRLRKGFTQENRKPTTLVVGLLVTGMATHMLLNEPINVAGWTRM